MLPPTSERQLGDRNAGSSASQSELERTRPSEQQDIVSLTWAASAILATLAVAVAAVLGVAHNYRLTGGGLWVPAVLFGLTILVERYPASLELRSGTVDVTAGELILVPAFFLLTPIEFIVCRVLAVLIALRPISPYPAKYTFNVALLASATGVEILAFRLLLPEGSEIGPEAWAAVAGAVVMGAVWSNAALAALFVARDGTAVLRPIARSALRALVLGLVSTGVGMAMLTLYQQAPINVLLLAAVAATVVGLYRSNAVAQRRLERVSGLYRFSSFLATVGHTSSGAVDVLEHVRYVFNSESAELVMTDARKDGGQYLVISTDQDHSGKLTELANVGVVAQRVLRTGESIDIASSSAAERAAEQERCGHESSLVVALRADGRIFGSLAIARRSYDKKPFDRNDLEMLETFGNHVGLWLEHGRMVERLRLAAAEREEQALHDALTGLPNRRKLADNVASAISAALAAGQRGAIALLDLDRFKEVNDTLGHAAGDRLLQVVARRMSRFADPTWTVARLGGDEFAVLVPDAAGRDEHELTTPLLDALSQTFEIDGIPVAVEGSFGVAYFPDDGRDMNTVLRHADIAMYAAKGAGVPVQRYTKVVDNHSRDRLALLADLRNAIDGESLVLHYQPKIDLRTGLVTSVEALIRWPRADGFIQPGQFIPQAEQSALMGPLTRWVLHTAIHDMLAWQRQGLWMGVAINLSARNLADPELPGLLDDLAATPDMNPNDVTLELTESAVISNMSRAADVLDGFRRCGYRVSLDDFGTGQASLQLLRALSFNEVKIDRSFVQEMRQDEDDSAIVHAVVELARALGLEVVAEGVQDRETLDLLAGIGCTQAQGYFLGKPVSACDLIAEITAPDARFPGRTYPMGVVLGRWPKLAV